MNIQGNPDFAIYNALILAMRKKGEQYGENTVRPKVKERLSRVDHIPTFEQGSIKTH